MSSEKSDVMKKSATGRYSRKKSISNPVAPLYQPGDLLYRRSSKQKAKVIAAETSLRPAFPIASSTTSATLSDQHSKWSFLQRLMAIEEAHDNRKLASQRRMASNLEGRISAHDRSEYKQHQEKTDKGMSTSHSVPAYLWTQGQVLNDDSLDDEEDLNQRLESYSTSETGIEKYPATDKEIHLPILSDSSKTSKTHGQPYFVRTESPMSATSKMSADTQTHQNFRRQISLSMNDLTLNNDNEERSFASSHNSMSHSTRKQRQLRLPPILLPKIYTISPRPLKNREFLTPTKIPGPITDRQWDELKECRYIRHVVFGHKLSKDSTEVSSN